MSKVLPFVAVWLVLLVVMGFFHLAVSGLASWAAGDAGYYKSPQYQFGQNAAYLLFGVTQLGALVVGVLLLQRGQSLIRVVVLLAGLYSIWFFGSMFLLGLR
jgi:hypothetical protein